MILDSKETNIDSVNRIYAEEDCMTEYIIDYEGLERGERYLRLPEGLRGICADAFKEYNSSAVIQNICRMLRMPEEYIAEWSKKITGKKLVKITFPPEAGHTVRERASFLVEKEKRVRLLRLHLPATMESISEYGFPDLLEEITVEEDNPMFLSQNGVLFSKDRKRLIRYPGYRMEESYQVPEGVEVLSAGAFRNSFLKELNLPSSLKRMEPGCFENTHIEKLEIAEGLEVIETDSFQRCEIREICLPESIRRLEAYAFRGICGIQKFTCDSEKISVGAGLFSEGNFDSAAWWPWEEISEAAFLNSTLKEIRVPEGVSTIADYAFAGCYQAKRIVLPESVKEIGKNSFDEGERYTGTVEIPSALYKYVYRFPPLSPVNGKGKSEIWKEKENAEFQENREVLERQQAAMKRYIDTLNVFQTVRKKKFEKEQKAVSEMLKQ